jgi:hypothetical protein
MPWKTLPFAGVPVIPPSALPNVVALWRADQGIVFGGMSAANESGGGGPFAVTFTGVPTFGVTQSFEVYIDGGGARGVATFTWFHNGVLQAAGVLTAAAVLLTDGVSVNFPVDVYVIGMTWTAVPVITSWTSYDASATVASQAVVADMPLWIAPGLVLTGFPAGAGGQATTRWTGVQNLAVAAFATPATFTSFTVVGAYTPSAGAEDWWVSGAGHVVFGDAATDWGFGDPFGNELIIYSGSGFAYPVVVGFTDAGAKSQISGSRYNCIMAVAALAGSLNMGNSQFVGDVPEQNFYGALTETQMAQFQNYSSARYGT